MGFSKPKGGRFCFPNELSVGFGIKLWCWFAFSVRTWEVNESWLLDVGLLRHTLQSCCEG